MKISIETIFPHGSPKDHYDFVFHWSKKLKIIYLALPKVASSSIIRFLQLNETNGDGSVFNFKPHDKINSPLLSPSDNFDGFKSLVADPDCFLFTFVRNPYDRVLSGYLEKIAKASNRHDPRVLKLGLDGVDIPSFHDFLLALEKQGFPTMDRHWKPQHLIARPQAIRYDLIGKLESYENDMATLLKRTGLTQFISAEKEGVEHATSARTLKEKYYGAKEIALVNKLYEQDFKLFDYSMLTESF
ncbi:sulfotransferase family protein [Temperatibacter marinus]|uniref:Sulfotransferase family protein n=1 Tax=Temperatibacter marinus TaxID=1456591 RepID=A0AA52EGQ4_9PROT|nr:sulfotransferase family protein [Temperatibacter marinus]WND03343.1 sulfotransferase family protein [Temperatibacter marinus]